MRGSYEEDGVGSVKIAQSLLLRSNMDSANPVEFFAQHGQFTCLGQVVDGVPCTNLEPRLSSWGEAEFE